MFVHHQKREDQSGSWKFYSINQFAFWFTFFISPWIEKFLSNLEKKKTRILLTFTHVCCIYLSSKEKERISIDIQFDFISNMKKILAPPKVLSPFSLSNELPDPAQKSDVWTWNCLRGRNKMLFTPFKKKKRFTASFSFQTADIVCRSPFGSIKFSCKLKKFFIMQITMAKNYLFSHHPWIFMSKERERKTQKRAEKNLDEKLSLSC